MNARLKNILGKFVKYGLPTLLSVGLCFALFRDINFREMYTFIVSECDFNWILASMALGVFSFWVRGMRWRIQLKAIDMHPPRRVMFYSIAGTYAVNIVVPRLGELWRCEYISRRERASFVSVLGSMFSERLVDTVTVLLMLLATLIFAGTAIDDFVAEYPDMFNRLGDIASSPWTYIILLSGIAAAWLFFRINRHRGWAVKLKAQLKALASGFSSIFHIRKAWLWLLLTITLWGTYVTQMFLCFEAFAPTSEYMAAHGPLIVMVSFVLASLSMAIPSNGGIGPYQMALGFGILFFMKDSLTPAQCYSFATLVLGAQTIVTIICGLVSFACIAIDNRRTSRGALPDNK